MCIVWVGNIMTPEKETQRFEMSKVMAFVIFLLGTKGFKLRYILLYV